jgi:Phospholipid methyltransferase
MVDRFKRLVGFFRGTPRRTFVLYPFTVITASAVHGRPLPQRIWGLPLLPWGYLQYDLTGRYRQRLRAGSRGFGSLPDRLITSGPYTMTRNPMYLGHLVFLTGLALAWKSRLGWIYLLASIPWFHLRVLEDERRLEQKFGDEYRDYCRRVKRWIPYLL